jgi:hypothetical protein
MEPTASAGLYILKWHEDDAAQHHWFIRGIKSNRTFYGEVIAMRAKRAFNVEGDISEADFAQLLSLTADIEQSSRVMNAIMPWKGLLAKGPIGHSKVFYTFPETPDHATPADRLFMKLIDVLGPYVRAFY